mgnify:CR=1 FL=1
MRRLILPVFVSLLLLAVQTGAAAASDGRDESRSLSDEQLYELFREPGPAWRGKPFWSWNGELEEGELIRQIHVIKEMGFGGFFMHSRTGLATEYLGDEWFELVNRCTDEAETLGMEAWLYDEDRWPSGTAGGLVTKNPEFRLKFVSLRTVEPNEFEWKDDVLAAFSCKLDGLAYCDCGRIYESSPAEEDPNKTILVFTIEEMEKSSFYNGYTYVDTLNREATQEFIRLTHEQYRQRCGDRLGKSLLGVFTDEPHRGSVMTGFGISNENKLWMSPWTAGLPESFRQQFGYDVVGRLPEVFLQKDGQAVSQVKWHYVELLQQLFLENFADPVYQWCRQNDMLLTGHVLHEDNLTCQTATHGSLMRFYEYMHYPGIDVLTEGNRNYWIAKQLSSVARQLGQKWLLSELYGCTGWQMSFENYKSVGDWQALFGINVRCPHLSWYTMKGESKRDYPASIFHQSGWWKDHDYLASYFARLGVMLSQGTPVCDMLVISPVESVWCQIYPGWAKGMSPQSAPVKDLEKTYRETFHALAGAQIDFDYADEEMLGRLYRIDTSEADQPRLFVGEAAYKAVLVAGMTTIRTSTIRVLREFMKAGGTVTFAGDPPEYVDAVESEGAAELASEAIELLHSRVYIVDNLIGHINRAAEIIDGVAGESVTDIFCQMRSDQERKYVVVMNVNREKGFDGVLVRIPGRGHVTEWNCATGERRAVRAEREGDWLEITTDFAPSQERVYVVTKREVDALPAEPSQEVVSKQACEGPFEYSLSEENVCVLDMARFRIDGNDWRKETEVLKIDQTVRRHYGLPLRGGEMVQPWFAKKYHPKPDVKGSVEIAYTFDIETMPDGPVALCMERPGDFTVVINGKKLDLSDTGQWWVDKCIRRIAVPLELLSKGKNEVSVKTELHEQVEFEALYLLGEFGVRLDGVKKTLTALPEKIRPNNLVGQGLPFYSGAVTYRVPAKQELTEGQRAFVSLPKFEGAFVKAKGEGTEPVMIAWQPYKAEVTQMLDGESIIELEVMLTRRNTFGPLHLVPMRSGAYGPGHWVTGGAAFADDKYMLYPSGLLEAPELQICHDKDK